MSLGTAQTLRERASRLRHLADEIERSSVFALHQHANDETWRGTRPQFCVNMLRRHQARLLHDATDLRWQANLFDQLAVEVTCLTGEQTGHAC